MNWLWNCDTQENVNYKGGLPYCAIGRTLQTLLNLCYTPTKCDNELKKATTENPERSKVEASSHCNTWFYLIVISPIIKATPHVQSFLKI
jgi:hypothetical protein